MSTLPKADQEIVLEAQAIGWRRHDTVILDHVNFQIHAGEIVTIIGPNGAGKTTLLKILLGILVPDTGFVRRKQGIRIGYVPQRMVVDSVLTLTVMRLLTLGASLKKHPQEIHETVQHALTRTGVSHLRNAALQELSGGEIQRVLLARAILNSPDILILDEPVQGVDYAGEIQLYRLIDALREQYGCSVLLVSHDLHVVMGSTDRVVCLNGHVCCAGEPDLISNHPEFIRLFGEHAVKTLALYQHHHTCDDDRKHH